jgi:hypothetical protein
MSGGCVPRRAADVAWTLVDGRVYAVAPAGPAPFQVVEFSETGSSIWAYIDGVASVSELVDEVATEWQVETGAVLEGVCSFLRQLRSQHLVEWDPASLDA